MTKISLFFSRILILVLSVVVLAGGIVSYRYGNFGGVSFEELTTKYIDKQDLKFSDLPLSMQERYIDKDATIEQSKDGYLLEDEYLDEKGNPIPESEVTAKDLRKMVKKLQKTLLFLQHDNLVVSNEKNELAKKVEEQQNEREEEKNSILNKNLERINEAEQQHYKNISDLTMKINELQKENVIIAQRANLEANSLKSEIEGLGAKAVEENEKKRQEIRSAREDEQSKVGDYKDKIKLLNDQIALLNDQMNANNETAKNAFNRKLEEITKLKDEISLASKEKNDILTKHGQTMVELERKQNEEIAKYNKTMESLKLDTEKLIAKNRQDMTLKEEENLKKVAIGEEKLKALQIELASSKKHIDALMLENEKDFNKFRTYLEDEKKLNKELTLNNKKLEEGAQNNEKSLNSVIVKLNEDVAKKESQIKDLELKITAMQSEKQNFDIEVKRKIDENDKIHNKNYKIFNEKIASFDSSKREMLEKLDKQLGEYKDASKENYDKMQFHTNELTRANNELKLKNDAKEKELQALQSTLLALKTEATKNKESEDAKLAQVRSAFDELRMDVKQKDTEYLAKITLLENEARAKETALANTKKEEALKVIALQKEIKTKEVELQVFKDEQARKEEALKSLHVKEKEADANITKAMSKQIEEFKNQLLAIEKNRISEDSKLVGLKDELKRRDIEYLDNLKALQKEMKQKEAQALAIKEESKKIDQSKLSQEEKFTKLKDEFKQREISYLDAIKTLEGDIKTKESQLGLSKKDESLKLLAVEKELKTNKEETRKQIASNEQIIKTLNEKIKVLETVTPKVETKVVLNTNKETKGQKLIVVDKISCTDMGTGVNALSDACKQSVQAFLSKYDDSYLFEVAPIVDNGGFASLKLIKSKKMGVEDMEIDRISGLANIGLGKARAKAGGELIEAKFGESAKISYALSNIEQDKARGFQIRVLK